MNVDRPTDLIEGSGQLGQSRRLDQMISARLDPRLVAALRHYAKRHDLSLSDVVREAALLLLAREQERNVITFSVAVTNERSGTVANRSFHQEIPLAV
jgi:hypothetical protein